MSFRNDLNSWRKRIEKSFEGLLFAAVSVFALTGVLASCVHPALIAA